MKFDWQRCSTCQSGTLPDLLRVLVASTPSLVFVSLSEVAPARQWNDPVLESMNPDITLPNVSIAPVHRYEASGTPAVFTSYLSPVSPARKSTIGAGITVNWPAGTGAWGNGGAASTVSITRGGIGYVESSFATENHLSIARLRNRSGMLVKPGAASFAATQLYSQTGMGAWLPPG
jgi:phosphate transport system substrate-binding protein